MKKSLVPILLVAGITALSGCANNADNTRNNIRTTDVRDNVQNNLDIRDNNRLSVSERAARNVESLSEVDRAHVILRGNNAYVAVRLNDRAGKTGTLNTGNNGTTGITDTNPGNAGNTNINTGNAGTTGITGIGGTSAGMNGIGRTGVTGTRAGDNTGNTIINGNTGTNGVGNNFGTTGTGTSGLNGTTASPNGTTGMTGTRDNNGAYSRVDTAFEQRVADQVRRAIRNVNKVYVSTNANFFDRMTTYSNDIRNGRNGDGLFRNFTDTTRGIFNNR